MNFSELSTTALIDYMKAAPDMSPREFQLLFRLSDAMNEIDLLTEMVLRLQCEVEEAA